jgi:phosphatidate cytidylyltransferase
VTATAPVVERAPAAGGSRSELGKRVASGVVMAALAIAAVVLGGWPFVLFWTAAAVGIFWEWSAIAADGAVAVRIAGIAALVIAALAAGDGQLQIGQLQVEQFQVAIVVLAAGAALVAGLCREHRLWGAAGVLYAGTLVVAPVLLRRDREFGLVSILFLFAVVWATDILGYFIGRAIGGSRLAPNISPNKTWSGAGGGAAGALAAGLVVLIVAGDAPLVPAAGIALALSVVSQAGDLFESAVKRRFGVKDASHILPGHGGLMDRLDGFLAAAGVAALVGLVRGGSDACARGLLLW